MNPAKLLLSHMKMHVCRLSQFHHARWTSPLHGLSAELHGYAPTLLPNSQMPKVSYSSSAVLKEGLYTRLKRRMYDAISDKQKVKIGGTLSYESCVDSVDFNEFFNYFNLPDTFQSWFKVMHLHVWIVMISVIAETNGRLFRNIVVESMWNDVEHRMTQLVRLGGSDKRNLLRELNDQFKAALISYDEGILCEDSGLAAAMWRTFFSFKDVDPQLLEDLVHYVRRQIAHVESLNLADIMFRGRVTLLPLKSILNEAR